MSRETICWRAVSVLSLAGLGLATYLSIVYVSGHVPACGEGGGCSAVTTSDYARFLGVPVAMIGVAGYSLLLLGSLAAAFDDSAAKLKYGLILSAMVGVVFSAYLTATQMFFIHQFCTYCLTSASLMTLILALTIAAVMLGRRELNQAARGSA